MLVLSGRAFSYTLGWGSAEQDCNRNQHKAGNSDMFNGTILPSHTSGSLLTIPVQIQERGCISIASLTHPHIVLRKQDVRKLTVKWMIFFFLGLFFFFKKMKRLFTRKWDMFYKHPLLKPIVSHPMNSEICFIHIRSSKSFTLRENLYLKHLPFLLTFCTCALKKLFGMKASKSTCFHVNEEHAKTF